MEEKRAYLMANARTIPHAVELRNSYDEEERINVELVAGLTRPLSLNALVSQTSSKTFAAPGDDDPDPDDERIY